MNNIEIENLQQDLDLIINKYNEFLRAKNKEKETLQAEITYFTNKLISDFKLLQYDNGIKEESHKTKFFIQDVEKIIRKETKV